MPLPRQADPGRDQLPWGAEMFASEVQEPLSDDSRLSSILDVEALAQWAGAPDEATGRRVGRTS